MTDTLNVTGSVEKTSESGGGFSFDIEVADDVATDTGSKTITIGAGLTQAIDLTDLGGNADGLIIKTPKTVLLTATFSGSPTPDITNLPVREWCILQTTGLATVSITNPATEDVRITFNAYRLQPTS